MANVEQETPATFGGTDQGVSTQRKAWTEKISMDMKLALEPVLSRLGRGSATYTLIEGGEAVVTAETRYGVRSFTSDSSANTEEKKKSLAVCRALDCILQEEGMEIRDHTHEDLVWATGAIQQYLATKEEYAKEVKSLENRIATVQNWNKALRQEIERGRAMYPNGY